MKADPRSPLSADWREIASLGEQIVSAPTLSDQRDIIVGVTSRLVKGNVYVWLREGVFRLPNLAEGNLFPEEPTLPGIKSAIKARDIRVKPQHGKKIDGSRGTWAAVPLEEQGRNLGALQVTRPLGPKFTSRELDSLKGIAGVVSVSLIAAHRIAVERFRLNQLNLVREVSSQIANVMSVDELSRRVTQLIQETFHYYYVAIFTMKPNFAWLRFRASAMPQQSGPPRKSKRRKQLSLEVEVGQGLIGEAAASGEQVLVNDVREDPRYRF